MEVYIQEALNILIDYNIKNIDTVTDLVIALLRIDTIETLELAQTISGVRILYLGCNQQPICDYNCRDYLNNL